MLNSPLVYTIPDYLESKTTAADRIVAIENLIDAMILTISEAIEGSAASVSEYNLDDGQVKIKTVYRSIPDIEEGIRSLERIKQLYVNRLNGRQVVLRDLKALRR